MCKAKSDFNHKQTNKNKKNFKRMCSINSIIKSKNNSGTFNIDINMQIIILVM